MINEKLKNNETMGMEGECFPKMNKSHTAYVLIGLGLVFLLMQSNVLSHFVNWWALFMVIPGALGLYQAYEGYQASGEWKQERVIGSSILTAMGLSFLIDLPMGFVWGTLWPVGLIALGAWLVYRQRTNRT